jgi:hypothetical protein
MAKFYLSKNYREIKSAGNKAKTDMEKILSNSGYKNAGLPQTVYANQIIGFIVTLVGVCMVFFKISAGDTVVIQYPFKKYYAFICHLIHWKKGKVITLIHDLGAFRRKRLSVDEEIRRLNHSDVLIVHNPAMKSWLQQQGYRKPMVCLEIWDYLSASANRTQHPFDNQSVKVIYAGTLKYKKNKFLYALDEIISKWQLELYGAGFEEKMIKNREHITYCGFIPSDQLIETAYANFGLVWDGDSTSCCSGNFGEYLKLNNPHKISFYIRCHCPVIIWEEAALATFITEHKIGLCVRSLEELDDVLSSISIEIYQEMVENVKNIDQRISSGYYLSKALVEANKFLLIR